MASILPTDAKSSPLRRGIPLFSANKKVASEDKGKIVAAKKADRNRLSSAILYSL